MGDNGAPKAPQLPPEAPADLRDFLECKSAKVTLKDGKLTWLPLPPEIKDFVPEGAKPDLSIEPGATPGTATIKVSLGPISLSLPASVSGGQLSVDTSDPGMFTPQKLVDGINQAVKDINDWFKHNGKGFGQPTFGKGVTLTKVDLAPPPAKTTPPPAPPTPTPGPPKPPPPPAAPPIAPAVPGGCLGILFLVLAVVAVGAVLFFGGPALGLFGTANPTAMASPTAASPTATPTASPTPPLRTVVSDDGHAFLYIPHDAAPAEAPITLTARGQADAPPELEGVTFRSSFYRIEPTDLTFSGEVGFGRIVDLTTQGLDPDEVGYSVTSLALRAYDGMWSWLGRQQSLIGGTSGSAPETQVQQQGSLMDVGEVFGFGGTVWAHRDPYPEQVEFAIGTTVRFGVKLTGPNAGPFVPGQGASIARAFKYVSLPGIVEAGEPVISTGGDGFPRVDVTLTCTKEGDFTVGLDATFTQTGVSDLLERLELGTPPDHEMSFRTSMRCVSETAVFQPVLQTGCVRVIHQRLSDDYPSFLRWLLGFWADPSFPADARLDLAYREGASGPLRTFADIPIVNGTAMADTGITSFGQKLFVNGDVKWSDGSGSTVKYSLIQAGDWDEVFGMTVNVSSAEEILAGNACPN